MRTMKAGKYTMNIYSLEKISTSQENSKLTLIFPNRMIPMKIIILMEIKSMLILFCSKMIFKPKLEL